MQTALPVRQPVERQTIRLAALALVGMAAAPLDLGTLQETPALATANPQIAIHGENPDTNDVELHPNGNIQQFSIGSPRVAERAPLKSGIAEFQVTEVSERSVSSSDSNSVNPELSDERQVEGDLLERHSSRLVFNQNHQYLVREVDNNNSPAETTGELLRERVVLLALAWKGTPYLWGGNTRSGVDCSGFVQTVYAQIGIELPRTSYEQFRHGVGIARSNLAPGDLVFFSTNGPGASHVGIYLGNDQFISATRTQVEIQSLSDPYWQKAYRGSRRVI